MPLHFAQTLHTFFLNEIDEEERLAAIRSSKAEIECRAAERYEREKTAYEKKIAQRRQKEQSSSKSIQQVHKISAGSS